MKVTLLLLVNLILMPFTIKTSHSMEDFINGFTGGFTLSWDKKIDATLDKSSDPFILEEEDRPEPYSLDAQFWEQIKITPKYLEGIQEEWDTFQKQINNKSLSDKEIVRKYHRFAQKMYPDAFWKLYDIYKDGLYGQKKDRELKNIYFYYAVNVGTSQKILIAQERCDIHKQFLKKAGARTETPTNLSESSDEVRVSNESIELFGTDNNNLHKRYNKQGSDN